MNILKYLKEKHSKQKIEHMPCLNKPLGIYSRKFKMYLPVLKYVYYNSVKALYKTIVGIYMNSVLFWSLNEIINISTSK